MPQLRRYLALASLLVVLTMAGSSCADDPYATSGSGGASSGGGFPDESDEELVQACMRGGSSRADCVQIVPLVRAADADGNGIADADE